MKKKLASNKIRNKNFLKLIFLADSKNFDFFKGRGMAKVSTL